MVTVSSHRMHCPRQVFSNAKQNLATQHWWGNQLISSFLYICMTPSVCLYNIYIMKESLEPKEPKAIRNIVLGGSTHLKYLMCLPINNIVQRVYFVHFNCQCYSQRQKKTLAHIAISFAKKKRNVLQLSTVCFWILKKQMTKRRATVYDKSHISFPYL